MKKRVSLLMAFILMVSIQTMDVKAADEISAWAVKAINAMSEEYLIPESIEGKYSKEITREEVCDLLVLFIEYQMRPGFAMDYDMEPSFDDTDSVSISKLYKAGIVNGVSDRKFNPDAKVEREQLAVMFAKTLEFLDDKEPLVNHAIYSSVEVKFADSGDISSWAKSAITTANINKILTGVGSNMILPKGTATVEQAIVITYRLKTSIETEGAIDELAKLVNSDYLVDDYHTADYLISHQLPMTYMDVTELLDMTYKDASAILNKYDKADLAYTEEGYQVDIYEEIGMALTYQDNTVISVTVNLATGEERYVNIFNLMGLRELDDFFHIKNKYPNVESRELGLYKEWWVEDGDYFIIGSIRIHTGENLGISLYKKSMKEYYE